MLIYNPTFDLHHGVFRFLQMLAALEKREVEVERLRIMDFFLLFPEQIEKITFPRGFSTKKSLFKRSYNPYRALENPQRIFSELTPFQMAAIQSLAARDLIDHDKFQSGTVQRTEKPIPPTLEHAILERNKTTAHLIDLVSKDFFTLSLYGDGGLRERVNLQETRYDAF